MNLNETVAHSSKITGPGTRPHRVVLYRREHSFHPYVVHYRLEEDGSMFQGTYVASLAEASAEFSRRCARWGVGEGL